MRKFVPIKIAKIGIVLSLLFLGTTLYGEQQQNSSEGVSASPLSPNEQAKKNAEIETQREKLMNEIQNTIVPEAISVVKDTGTALKDIQKGQIDDAKTAITNAETKINGLLSKHPRSAALPVDFEIDIVDLAPAKIDSITEVVRQAEKAMKEQDYPTARLYLDSLQSEISATLYALPLAIYPELLKKAKQLLNENKPKEAEASLEFALNSLIILQQNMPIPIIESKVLLALAEENQQDKTRAEKLIKLARLEFDRAQALGYLSQNTEDNKAMDASLNALEKKIQNNESNPKEFQILKDKFGAFLKRYFGEKKKSANQQMNGT